MPCAYQAMLFSYRDRCDWGYRECTSKLASNSGRSCRTASRYEDFTNESTEQIWSFSFGFLTLTMDDAQKLFDFLCMPRSPQGTICNHYSYHHIIHLYCKVPLVARGHFAAVHLNCSMTTYCFSYKKLKP